MSFDLIVESKDPSAAERAREDFSARDAARSCEVYGGGASFTAGMPRDEADMAAAYAALVEVAREHGCEIINPQTGGSVSLDAPGRLPEGW